MSNLKEILSLYWLIVPRSEVRKLMSFGKILSTNHDKIDETLSDEELFEFALEQSTVKDQISKAAKHSLREDTLSVLLLSDTDLKKIKQNVYIKLEIYQDFIEEKYVRKIFGVRRY